MITVMLLLTVLLWGIAPIFDKAALREGDPFLGVIIRSITVGAIMLGTLIASGKIKGVMAMPGRAVLFFLISGLFAGALGVFTYYKALQYAPTSKIVPLVSTYPLVTAVLSVIFLGESISLARIAGIIFIVIGILLVK